MSNVVGERYFISPEGRMAISQFPHGVTGFLGDWTEGETALFEQLCAVVLETLPDSAGPMDIVLALGWTEMTKEGAETVILQKHLDANVADGRMKCIKKEGSEDMYQMTEAGRIYVEQFLPARARA